MMIMMIIIKMALFNEEALWNNPIFPDNNTNYQVLFIYTGKAVKQQILS